MLSGYTRADKLTIYTNGQNCDNLVWFDKIHSGNFDWGAAQSTLNDLRYTLDDGITLLNYVFLDQPQYARQFVEVMVSIPGTPPPFIYRQYGNSAATAVSSAQHVLQQPPVNSDGTSLAVLWFSEGTGTTTANKAGGASWNITATGGWKYQLYCHIWRRSSYSLEQVNRSDLVTWNAYGGVYLDGASDGVFAPAGFLDTPPANGTLDMYFRTLANTGGTIFSKYSDANNYLTVTYSGSTLTVTKCNAGVANSIPYLNSSSGAATHLRVSWGAAGFAVWINGCAFRRIIGDTAAWGSGSLGLASIGILDNGSLSSNQVMFLGSVCIMAREMTMIENQCRIYLVPPIPTTAMCTKLVQANPNPLLTGSLAWEDNVLQETSVMGPLSD